MVTTAPTHEVRTRTTVGAVVSVGYGFGCYLAFVAAFLYAVAFLADVVVPVTVDRGGPHAGTLAAVTVDAALLMVFAVQHSVMARPAFKRRWTRLVPQHVERSTYVLADLGGSGARVLAVAPDPDRRLGRVERRCPRPAVGALRVGMGVGPCHDVCDRPPRHVRAQPGRASPPRTRRPVADLRPPVAAPAGPSSHDARLLPCIPGRTHDDGRSPALRRARRRLRPRRRAPRGA